jgi:cysteinyl-tRNA synthetase
LPKLGVRFEDGANHTSVKLVDPEILLREQEQKRAIEEAKRAEKERKQREKEEKERQKALTSRIPPDQLFKQGPHEGKFSQFDVNGLPTHDAEGKEVSKGQRKKLEKLWQDHKRLYESAASTVMNGN